MKDLLSENFAEECIESKLIHKGSILEFKLDKVRLPNGKTSSRELVLHPGGIVIIPITRDGKFVLVEQYRYATGEKLTEFPAGRLNLKEDPTEAARRELTEETGYTAGKIESLGFIYTAPGFCNEKLFMFLATELQEGKPNPDEDEFVRTIHLSRDELSQKIKSREITDAKTIAGWGLIN
ncbi:MAG: NUDIX hydrolase [Candidatus Caenarcaniphilales bacterium]|nr:NUDIX hydrolase [Candidatus Caenarcaniphilales bacterium]